MRPRSVSKSDCVSAMSRSPLRNCRETSWVSSAPNSGRRDVTPTSRIVPPTMIPNRVGMGPSFSRQAMAATTVTRATPPARSSGGTTILIVCHSSVVWTAYASVPPSAVLNNSGAIVAIDVRCFTIVSARAAARIASGTMSSAPAFHARTWAAIPTAARRVHGQTRRVRRSPAAVISARSNATTEAKVIPRMR